jgi:hypothetical protein
MKINKLCFRVFVVLLFGVPLISQAGPSVEVADTTTPPRIDGDLSDWTVPPVITLDKKEYVVVGSNDWTGPDYCSGKIYITYDKTNLYIAADIASKTPQFNSQDASEIYNGDALEVYVGTDLTDPKRSSYSPTDVQIFISPGKNGDNAQVYSMTDKSKIPGAKVATELTKAGYTLEASIPLKYFYKINVGPGKSIGFDVSIDDVGAVSKVRTLQMAWSQQDKSWQDPSQWGTLTFKGDTVYVNNEPKMAMPGAVQTDLDPKDGAKGASTEGELLWGFNGDLGGFTGSVTLTSDIISEGTGALLVNTDGSSGWNQNLAASTTIPMADKWETFKAISLDVYFPPKSLAKAGYGELYIVTQSPANNWYEIKMKMNEGWNHIKQDVDSSQFKGGVTKAYLVFNSGGPIAGQVAIDNIRGIVKGAATVLKGKVTQLSGKPVAGAIVAIAKKLVKTTASGSFSIDLPADEYTAEVFCPGYEAYRENITVNSTAANTWNVTLNPSVATVKPAVIDAFFDKPKVRSINPHYMFGNNIAAWYDPKWCTDETGLKKAEDISSYFRLPGGAFANRWRWKTGDTLRKDGQTVETVWDFKWPQMVEFLTKTHSEPLLIANIMTMDVQNCLDWIADAKAQGLTVRYVELGNEPDYEADLFYNNQNQYWTVIDNYCQHFIEFAKAIKSKYPDIKIMGPAVAQVENHERKEGSPWLAPASAPWWVEKFLEECGPYVDVVSVHSYPYWSNDSDSNLLSKTNHWAEFVPKIREAIQKNIPDRYKQIEISVSEWNSGDENATTARLVNGLFCADYLAQMMLYGVNQTNIWDLYTQKPGLGGGHGVLDPNNDPDHPFAERAHYWALYMMKHYFGTTIYQAVANNDDLSAYASTGDGKEYVMVINKSPKKAYKTAINTGNSKARFKTDIYELSSKEYQWSENLYRTVINSGPSHLKSGKAVKSRFEYTFPPYSITCIVMTPTK